MKTIKNKEELTYKCFDLYDMLIITTDQQGRIMLLNKTGHQLFDFEEQEMIGKLWTDFLVSDDEKAIFEDFLRHYKETGTDVRINRFMVKTGKDEIKNIEFKMVVVKNNGMFESVLMSGKDITNHIKIQQNLHQSISLHRLLAANVPDINMYLFDTDMRFVIAEGSEMKNHGLTPEYFEGKTISELYDDNMHDILEPLLKCALEGAEITTEVIYNAQSYKISVFPLFDGSGQVQGGISISQNITKEKENARHLSNAKKEAERANKAKSEFLANISHELRTPLSAIVGFTEQLLKMEMPPKQYELTRIIEKSTEQLMALVEDLLVISKIEAGRIDLDENLFRINNVIEYIYRFMKVRADKKGIDFQYSITPEINQVVVGDEYRLNQILTNLVSNAIKFTDKGSVNIQCCVEEETDNQLFVSFKISDTGIGIPEDKVDIIFEQFRQADAAVTKKYGGTGLGLSISKRLVEMLNGTIRVDSEVGSGTTFTVQIPFEKGDELEYLSDGSSEQKISFEGKSALLVDDDSMIRLLGKIILENLGFEVELADDGTKAIEELNENHYDVVLLDIHMPGVSGIDVANFLRQTKRDNKTKILAVTASFMKEDVERYKEAGIDAYMSKPFKENKLYNSLCTLFGRKEQTPDDDKLKKTGYRPDEQKKPYDLNELKLMAGNDDDFLLSMLETFTQNVKEGLKIIKRSNEKDDWEEAGEVAHKLLPSFLHLKVKGIVPLLRKLEKISHYQADIKKAPQIVDELIVKTEKVLKLFEKEKEILRD